MELAFIDAAMGRGDQLWVTLSADRVVWEGAVNLMQQIIDTGESYAHINCTSGRLSGAKEWIVSELKGAEEIAIRMPNVVYVPLINSLSTYSELINDGRIDPIERVSMLTENCLASIVEKVNEQKVPRLG